MQKIVFVCLGNICRSPLAEALFQHEIDARGKSEEFYLDSCGTNGLHDGESADSRTRRNAAKHGVTVPSISRKIRLEDLDNFDVIFTMDKSVHDTVLRLCNTDEQRDKVTLFRAFDTKNPGADVPDPWFGGEEGFEQVFHIIKENTEIWVNRLC